MVGAGRYSSPHAAAWGHIPATAGQLQLCGGGFPRPPEIQLRDWLVPILEESDEGPQELLSSLQVAVAEDAAHPAPGHAAALARSVMAEGGQPGSTAQHVCKCASTCVSVCSKYCSVESKM